MSEQQASEEQTSTDEQSQADSQHSSTEHQQATEQTSEPTELKDLPAWAQKQIRDARKDAEKSRLKVQEFEDANKTEAERSASAAKAAEERATAAEQQLRSERAERTVLAAATASYANDPDAILALALPKLEFDDDGKPSNVDTILAALKKERPDRFKASAGSADGGKGGDGPPPNDFNAQIRAKMNRR